ncbi:putative NADH dehydrogenase I chain C/D [Halobacteriovorax marinus SJ]|uniref:NADH dehydrogenase I chain C/D n=1 Tax=Halobacteriovorax marinus (strain ATCC BAA-682 / DSM 15412 / SJ) TaxID=862908 RepID=E1X480_HALMS|nr:NADH-quinone oxidoreductase subunit C [Halobacteriovorax marinus]CBW27052.1 putative NADH dehydrogenase I chain C/D [Halobacteriovorax marinus SJ]
MSIRNELSLTFNEGLCERSGVTTLILDESKDLKSTLKKLKETFGFIMLLDIIAIDNSKKENATKRFQLSYFLLNMEEHFRLQVILNFDNDRQEILPSASDIWTNAHWCEREIWEMFGISFGPDSEHRLLTPKEIIGFPLRKDFQLEIDEDYKSREFSFSKNLSLPKYKENLLETISIGPIHPEFKGSMKMNFEVEGDFILRSNFEVGYLHRGIEKTCEQRIYAQIPSLIEKLNFFSSAANSVGWCKAVEELSQIDIPDKAKAIRMVLCEFARVSDHAQCLASMVKSTGIFEGVQICRKISNKVANLFSALNGSTKGSYLNSIGGLNFELPVGWINDCLDELKSILSLSNELSMHLNRADFWKERLQTAPLNAYEAIDLGVSGPNLRSCGVNYDIRKVSPYYFYEDVDFDIPLGINGDSYDRFLVRVEEIRQSLRIISQVLDSLPAGQVRVDKEYLQCNTLNFKVQEKSIYSMIEAVNGELGFYIESDGSNCPYRVKIKAPSFSSAQAFSRMLPGTRLEDCMVSLSSMNIVLGELDR